MYLIRLIGPIILAVPPLVLAVVADSLDALWVLLAYIAIYVAIRQTESNLLTPLATQKATSLHPPVVTASVPVAGAVLGPVLRARVCPTH